MFKGMKTKCFNNNNNKNNCCCSVSGEKLLKGKDIRVWP